MIFIRLIILLLLYICSNVDCNLMNRESDNNNKDVNNNNNNNNNKDVNNNNRRQLLEEKILSTEKKIDTIISTEEKNIEKEEGEQTPIVRTATGGFIHTIMVFLTIVSFIGNGAFMVYVFWLSR